MTEFSVKDDVWGKSRLEQRRLRRELAAQNKLKYASRFLPIGFLCEGEKILLAQSHFLGSTYIITSKRIVKREGWIRKKYTECPLEKIESVKIEHSGNKNFGDINFAIKDGQLKQLKWEHVRNPEAVYKTATSVIHPESEKV